MRSRYTLLTAILLLTALTAVACKKDSSPAPSAPSAPANTPTPLFSPTPTLTPTITLSPTVTDSPTKTWSPTATSTATNTPTHTLTSTDTDTPTATDTPTSTKTFTPTETNTPPFICTASPVVTPRDEVEFNGSIGSPHFLGTLSPTGLWLNGTLDSATDANDYFLFTADTTGFYFFYLDCRDSALQDIHTIFHFYDATGDTLGFVSGTGLLTFPLTTVAGQAYYFSVTTTGGSGSYQVKLSDAVLPTPTTTLTPICTATPGIGTPVAEAEPNQNIAAAQDLGTVAPGGMWVSGSVNVNSDSTDYLKFQAASSATYTVYLDCWDTGGRNFFLYVYEGTTTLLGMAPVTPGTRVFSFSATSGLVYTLRVAASAGRGPYQLKF